MLVLYLGEDYLNVVIWMCISLPPLPHNKEKVKKWVTQWQDKTEEYLNENFINTKIPKELLQIKRSLFPL